jgi:hypothetical protein
VQVVVVVVEETRTAEETVRGGVGWVDDNDTGVELAVGDSNGDERRQLGKMDALGLDVRINVTFRIDGFGFDSRVRLERPGGLSF